MSNFIYNMNWSSIVKNNDSGTVKKKEDKPIKNNNSEKISKSKALDPVQLYETYFDNKFNTDIEDIYFDMKEHLSKNCIKILDNNSREDFVDFYYLIFNNTRTTFNVNEEDSEEEDELEINEYF